ncbi:MAG: fasciclin domain-containing protein [Flavobacteriaceae bacterium]|nr:fasciclin domain-containing protein [Flavobacteriaceae bacterium]
MKTLLKTKTLLLLLSLTVLTSCSNDDDNNATPTPNIVETALATPDLSILVQALQAADGDLITVLNGDGPFTVLAPTNAAFNNFLTANGFASLDDVPTDVLSQILLNHVISGEVLSTNLSTGYVNTSASGVGGNNLSLYVNTSSGVRFNGVSNVSTADVVASNGVVHIVDAVIGLPDVTTFATADPNFSSLVSALTADASFTYVSTLQTPDGTSPAPFTVFAPTNTAFQNLLDSNPDWNTLADIPTATLSAVLEHHVIAANNIRSSVLSDGLETPATLEGSTLTVNIDGANVSLTDGSGGSSNVIAVDVQGVNGVIHAIDTVLIPSL